MPRLRALVSTIEATRGHSRSQSRTNFHVDSSNHRQTPEPQKRLVLPTGPRDLRGASFRKKQQEKSSKNHWHWAGHADNSRLVEVFLWEKRHDEAWQEASAGGCSESLWLRIAATREVKHPGNAVPIYKEMIAPILKRANNAYAEAVKLLQKIRELMGRLGRVTEFEDYLAALRVEYKRKRNFIKLLEGIESSPKGNAKLSST